MTRPEPKAVDLELARSAVHPARSRSEEDAPAVPCMSL